MTREEAIRRLKANRDSMYFPETKEALDMAIEALEADRPRGEWIKATEATWKCSLCDGIMYVESNYCPFCGAKMEGERSEEWHIRKQSQ